jgi:hypothetical protein
MADATQFSAPTGVRWANADMTYGQVQYGDESKLVVVFYDKPLFNKVKSVEKGARHYDNVTYVKIHSPGELLNIIDRPATQADQHRFRRQWSLFLQGRLQVPDGTPIDLLFPNNPAAADNLRAFGVYTIQQLAELSAHGLDRIGMGGQEYKNMAVRYLENATSGAAFIQMQEQLQKKDQEITVLNQKLERAIATIEDINFRMDNPGINRAQPQVPEGVDITTERINANHPGSQRRKGGKKNIAASAPPKDELEQVEIIEQVTEENFGNMFPPVDVTKEE